MLTLTELHELKTRDIEPINLIKNRDTRCSKNCIKNWTKYNQHVPKYQICECNKNNILFINK